MNPKTIEIGVGIVFAVLALIWLLNNTGER